MITNPTPRAASTLALLLCVGLGACRGCPGQRAEGGPKAPAPAGGASRTLAEVPAGVEVSETRFSPDGRHVAFVATQGAQAWVHVDARRYGPYEGARGIDWPEGREEPVFVARRDGQEFLVVGGAEGRTYTEIGTVRLAAGGTAVYSAKRGGRWLVVAGAAELEAQSAADPEPVPSPDGKRVTFLEQRGKDGPLHLRSCAIELGGCAAGAAFEAIGWQQATRGGATAAAVASQGGRDVVLTVDLAGPGHVERAGPAYDAVGLVGVSPDGRHVAALARRGTQHLLLKDGVEAELPTVDTPLDLVVAADGRTMLTGIMEGRVAVLLDGRRLGELAEGVYFPRFAPAGSATVFVAEREGRSTLVVDGEPGPTYDKIVGPAWSPDGAHLVFRARQDGQRFVVIANARGQAPREAARHEAVFELAFPPDGKSVGYGVQDGRELRWVVEPL